MSQLTLFALEKKCNRCGFTKPMTEFHKRNGRPIGFQPRCKTCQAEMARLYRENPKYKEVSVSQQQCKNCREIKNANLFSKNPLNRTGLDSWCKNCHRISKRESIRGKMKNEEYRKKINEKHLLWRKKKELEDPFYLQKRLEKDRQRHKEIKSDPERYAKVRERANYLERQKTLTGENKERRIAKQKKSRRAEVIEHRRHLDRINAAKRRARKLNNGIFEISNKDKRKLRNDCCYMCGAPADHIEHIIPLSKGGRHSIGNLAASCKSCNLRKHTKFLSQFKYQMKTS
jgi:5-methylcytosine-specific restriction endonuclease McrA